MRGMKAPARLGVPPPPPVPALSAPPDVQPPHSPWDPEPGCYAGEPGLRSLLTRSKLGPAASGRSPPSPALPRGGRRSLLGAAGPTPSSPLIVGQRQRARTLPGRPAALRRRGWTRGPLSRLGPAPGALAAADPATGCLVPWSRGRGPPSPARLGESAAGWGLLCAGRPLSHPGGGRDGLGGWELPPPGTESGRSLLRFLPSFPTCPRGGDLLWGETADSGRVTEEASVAKRARTPVLDRSNKQKRKNGGRPYSCSSLDPQQKKLLLVLVLVNPAF